MTSTSQLENLIAADDIAGAYCGQSALSLTESVNAALANIGKDRCSLSHSSLGIATYSSRLKWRRALPFGSRVS